MSELRARRYEPRDREAWDRHVRASRMPHPLLERAWIEHHADRFDDASLVVESGRGGGHVVAVIPASAHGDRVVSHGGLTFGGIVTTRRVGAARMLDVVDAVMSTFAAMGFAQLRYKPAPHIFHDEPAEEDLFAIVARGGRLVRRDIGSAIRLARVPEYAQARRASLRRGRNAITIRTSRDTDAFHALLVEVLARHDATPVHDARELRGLLEAFPDSIKCLGAWSNEDSLIGGIITVSTPVAVHTQYIGATEAGRAVGAVDHLLHHLIEGHRTTGHRWLSLGTSVLGADARLNPGLIAHKESFGARAVVFDHYDVPLAGRVGRPNPDD